MSHPVTAQLLLSNAQAFLEMFIYIYIYICVCVCMFLVVVRLATLHTQEV